MYQFLLYNKSILKIEIINCLLSSKFDCPKNKYFL